MEHRIVELQTTIGASIADVWNALTGEGATVMPMTKVATDWKVGNTIVFSGQWNGSDFEDHGEIVAATEREVLSFTHWSGNGTRPDDYHLVTYTLSPIEQLTHVTLVQSNIGPKPEPSDTTKVEFARTFQLMLDGLKQSSENR